MSQTESHILSRPFGRRIAQIGDADAAGEPTFDRGCDQTRSDEGHLDRHVDVTNAALVALSDLFDIVDSAGNDLIQPLPPACDGLEQTGSTLGIERADLVS